jgi:formamidopyrimidine-DNA glycosylase
MAETDVPELPDLVVYVEALRRHLVGRALERVRLLRPFVLRSVEPPPEALHGTSVCDVWRMGKRLVFAMTPRLTTHLLRALSDRRPPTCRSIAVAPLETRLASID